jgi:hypothetical protein
MEELEGFNRIWVVSLLGLLQMRCVEFWEFTQEHRQNSLSPSSPLPHKLPYLDWHSSHHSMESLLGDKGDEGGNVFCLLFIVKSYNSIHSIWEWPSEKATQILLMSPSYPWEGSTTWFYSMLLRHSPEWPLSKTWYFYDEISIVLCQCVVHA